VQSPSGVQGQSPWSGGLSHAKRPPPSTCGDAACVRTVKTVISRNMVHLNSFTSHSTCNDLPFIKPTLFCIKNAINCRKIDGLRVYRLQLGLLSSRYLGLPDFGWLLNTAIITLYQRAYNFVNRRPPTSLSWLSRCWSRIQRRPTASVSRSDTVFDKK